MRDILRRILHWKASGAAAVLPTGLVTATITITQASATVTVTQADATITVTT